MTALHFQSRHETGNIFVILSMVRREMQKQHRISEYNDLWQKAQYKDYATIIRLIREKVDLIDDDGVY